MFESIWSRCMDWWSTALVSTSPCCCPGRSKTGPCNLLRPSTNRGEDGSRSPEERRPQIRSKHLKLKASNSATPAGCSLQGPDRLVRVEWTESHRALDCTAVRSRQPNLTHWRWPETAAGPSTGKRPRVYYTMGYMAQRGCTLHVSS